MIRTKTALSVAAPTIIGIAIGQSTTSSSQRSAPRRGRAEKTAVIVGAGVIGLSVALSLQRRDWQVTVIDDRRPGAASSAAAGILFPTSAQRSAGLAGQFSLQAVSGWQQWAEGLGGGLLRSGGISFFADDDSRQDLAILAANIGQPEPQLPRSEQDCPGWSYLSKSAQARVSAALHIPDGQSLDPVKLLTLLRRAVGYHSVVTDRVEHLLASERQARGVLGQSGQRYYGQAVIAAPGAAPTTWLPNELRPRIDSLVGEGLLLASDAYRSAPAAIYPFTAGPLSSRPGQVWLGGSYRREKDGCQPHLGTLREIINRGVDIFPDLAAATVQGLIYGRRPITADLLPIVGPSQLPGLYWAAGHGKDGILHSALVGRQIIDWLEKDHGPPELLANRAALGAS